MKFNFRRRKTEQTRNVSDHMYMYFYLYRIWPSGEKLW